MTGGHNMKDKKFTISSELVAAYLDGHATLDESLQILAATKVDSELRELLEISMAVDVDFPFDNVIDVLPMTALAANHDENLCVWLCERYILEQKDVKFDEDKAIVDMQSNGWLKTEGVNLFNVGRYSETLGLSVQRIYDGTLNDIDRALKQGCGVIAIIDGGELQDDCGDEICEDNLIGRIPDHAVVVTSYQQSSDVIELYDPNAIIKKKQYKVKQFLNAWADSKYYYVTINLKTMNTYNPKPIDLSDVELTDDLNELREAIAENAHEIWAEGRKAEGWTYGPERNDEKKHNPCMVPYSELPDSEKQYDREMAMKTIKLLKKLGYDLIKREDTDLYRDLISRIRDSKVTYYCSHCWSKGIKTPVSKHQVFCHVCGNELRLEDLYKG